MYYNVVFLPQKCGLSREVISHGNGLSKQVHTHALRNGYMGHYIDHKLTEVLVHDRFWDTCISHSTQAFYSETCLERPLP